jgi:hypothetical protein
MAGGQTAQASRRGPLNLSHARLKERVELKKTALDRRRPRADRSYAAPQNGIEQSQANHKQADPGERGKASVRTSQEQRRQIEKLHPKLKTRPDYP